MTLLNIDLRTPAADGTLIPASGVLRFTPTRRRVDGAVAVLPKPFNVDLIAGVAAVTLAPTAAGWLWRIDEHVTDSPLRTIYAAIPDQASIPYADLAPLDPATLAPDPSPEPAWVPAIAAVTLTPDPSDPGFFLIGAS